MISAYAEKYGMGYTEAADEVLSEGIADILPQSRAMETLAEKHRDIFGKILDTLKKWLSEVKTAFAEMVENTDSMKPYLTENIDGSIRYVQEIVDRYDALLVAAVENKQAGALKKGKSPSSALRAPSPKGEGGAAKRQRETGKKAQKAGKAERGTPHPSAEPTPSPEGEGSERKAAEPFRPAGTSPASRGGNAAKTQQKTVSGEETGEGQYKRRKPFEKDKYYDRQVDKWGELKDGERVKVGIVGEGSALNEVGFPAEGMWFDVGKIRKSMEKHGDHLTEEILKQIPGLLNNPIAITEYRGQKNDIDNTVSVYGMLMPDGETPIMVGVMMAKATNGVTVINKIRTIHARGNAEINDRNILYLNEDKKRTRKWFQVCGISVPLNGTKFGLIRKIAYTGENVKGQYKRRVKTDSEGREISEGQQEYFKDSKVLDEDGNLRVVYHGTDVDFTVFDRTKARANMDIQGSFFSPWEEDAGGYGEKTKAYYLNITNPAPEGVGYKALNRFKGQNGAGIKAREYLESLGYDGVNNGDEEYIAFHPEQIKLITNKNPTADADIRYRLRQKTVSDTEILDEAVKLNPVLDAAHQWTAAEADAMSIYQKRLEKVRELEGKNRELAAKWKAEMFGVKDAEGKVQKKADRAAAAETMQQKKGVADALESARDKLKAAQESPGVQSVLRKTRDILRAQQEADTDEMAKRYADKILNSQSRERAKKDIERTAAELMKWMEKPDVKSKRYIPDALKMPIQDIIMGLEFREGAKVSAMQLRAAERAITWAAYCAN